jgi:hypothetical protein
MFYKYEPCMPFDGYESEYFGGCTSRNIDFKQWCITRKQDDARGQNFLVDTFEFNGK